MKAAAKYQIKDSKNLSNRVQWLRDYFFKGAQRKWKNELIPFTTGTDGDILYDETNFYAAPKMHAGLALITPCLLDADMLRDAQKNPYNYRHLLVRVTGYNAYFAMIGKELQDEIIARESHSRF